VKICQTPSDPNVSPKEREQDDLKRFQERVLKMRPKRHIRVRSQPASSKCMNDKKKFTPKDLHDIAEIKEFDF